VENRERNPIAKAIKALAFLVESESSDVGVRELAAALKISPSNAHRILLSLAEEGLVKREPTTQRYALGVELLRLAYVAAAKAPVRQAGLEAMRRLVDLTNETALLGIYDSLRQEMIFSACMESSHPLRYVIALNKWVPVHTGASGLAIMAFLREDEIQSIIVRSRLAPLTARSITEPYRLQAELARVRQQGYAFTRGQRIPGAVGLGAPIFDGSGSVVGDICLTMPEQRFDDRNTQHLAEILIACASDITRKLGGVPRSHADAA
jgi:DNA-binding IclR family transcriptional regulator